MLRSAARPALVLAILALMAMLLWRPAAAEPDALRVLLDGDAGAFVAALEDEYGEADPPLTADVVVLIAEPYGLVRIVLIDTEARVQRWAQVRPEALAAILAHIGDGA